MIHLELSWLSLFCFIQTILCVTYNLTVEGSLCIVTTVYTCSKLQCLIKNHVWLLYPGKVSSCFSENVEDSGYRHYRTKLIIWQPTCILVHIFWYIWIRVITKLPNSEQSYKGKVKTHKYINKKYQSTTGKLWKP